MKFMAVSILIGANSIVIERFISNQYQIPALKMREGLIVKKLQNMALVGGDSFLLSRSSMSGNKLNLSDWYGNQEIRHLNDKKIRTISYKIHLSKNSDIFLYWAQGIKNIDGIRIENNKRITFRKQRDETVKTTILSNAISLPHEVAVEISQSDGGVLIIINKQKYYISAEELGGNWGIRSDESKVEVENIRVTFGDSSVYYQNFEADFNPKYFLISIVLLLFVCIFAIRIPLNTIIYFKYLLLVFVATWYLIDLKIMSKQQVEALTGSLKPTKESGFWRNLEYYRTKVFYPEFVLNELRDFVNSKYPAERIIGGPIVCIKKEECQYYSKLELGSTPVIKFNTKQFMFVGTSQTIGAGASELKRTFFSLFHERINKNEDSVSFNISQSSLSPEEMLERFIAAIAIYKPTHVVVNLGYNQASYSLKKVLAEFYKLTKKIDAKIVFVREANKLAEESEYLREVDQFTKENSLPTIDLYGYLRSPPVNEDISIWWDPVHFNDRGQRLAADFIYEEFLRLKFL